MPGPAVTPSPILLVDPGGNPLISTDGVTTGPPLWAMRTKAITISGITTQTTAYAAADAVGVGQSIAGIGGPNNAFIVYGAFVVFNLAPTTSQVLTIADFFTAPVTAQVDNNQLDFTAAELATWCGQLSLTTTGFGGIQTDTGAGATLNGTNSPGVPVVTGSDGSVWLQMAAGGAFTIASLGTLTLTLLYRYANYPGMVLPAVTPRPGVLTDAGGNPLVQTDGSADVGLWQLRTKNIAVTGISTQTTAYTAADAVGRGQSVAGLGGPNSLFIVHGLFVTFDTAVVVPSNTVIDLFTAAVTLQTDNAKVDFSPTELLTWAGQLAVASVGFGGAQADTSAATASVTVVNSGGAPIPTAADGSIWLQVVAGGAFTILASGTMSITLVYRYANYPGIN